MTDTAPVVDIRPLRTQAELQACVELQRDTWGRTFSDVVPASILKVSQRVGGVAAGAFDEKGTLLGFVYGMTGVEQGRLVHWSDMLAVRPEARDLGLGRRLKEYQRREMQKIGAGVIYWTYDPLVARNAHLNFNVLGVRAVEYVQDMYGDTDSELHRGIGTDRFIVGWPTADDEMRARLNETRAAFQDTAFAHAPVLNPGTDRDQAATQTALAGAALPDRVRIEVPLDINSLQKSSPALAAAWRRTTRAAFLRTACAEHVVSGFRVDEQAARGYYLLARIVR